MKRFFLFFPVIFSIILFTFDLNCYSQFKRIGVKTGLNLAKVRYTNVFDFIMTDSYALEMENIKNIVGFNFGFLSQSSSNSIFVTDFGFFYSLRGYKNEFMKLYMHYLEIPLIFKARIPIIEPVSIQGGFGPYAGYAFLGKINLQGLIIEDILSWRTKYEKNIFEGEVKPYNPFDVGVIFGGDVEIKLPNNNFLLVGGNYHLGIYKVSNERQITITDPDTGNETVVGVSNPGMKHNYVSFNVTYLFDITNKKASKNNNHTNNNTNNNTNIQQNSNTQPSTNTN